MGLTIHYALHTNLKYRREIRRFVNAVRGYALDMPFLRVGEVREFAENDPQPTDEADAWLRLQSDAHIEAEGHYHMVPAKHALAFMVWPGEGCEVATFGFARFPAYIHYQGRPRIATGIKGWNWSSFCETQYASQPEFGGVRNFLHCHISLVRMLDFYSKVGLCRVKVRDESGYWQHRNVVALGKEVGGWNNFIAGITREQHDAADRGNVEIASAILTFPNYEQIELRGLERLANLRNQYRTRSSSNRRSSG